MIKNYLRYSQYVTKSHLKFVLNFPNNFAIIILVKDNKVKVKKNNWE